MCGMQLNIDMPVILLTQIKSLPTVYSMPIIIIMGKVLMIKALAMALTLALVSDLDLALASHYVHWTKSKSYPLKSSRPEQEGDGIAAALARALHEFHAKS